MAAGQASTVVSSRPGMLSHRLEPVHLRQWAVRSHLRGTLSLPPHSVAAVTPSPVSACVRTCVLSLRSLSLSLSHRVTLTLSASLSLSASQVAAASRSAAVSLTGQQLSLLSLSLSVAGLTWVPLSPRSAIKHTRTPHTHTLPLSALLITCSSPVKVRPVSPDLGLALSGSIPNCTPENDD